MSVDTRKEIEPVFITKAEIAHHLGIKCLATLDKWIATRRLPPPFDRPGERHPVWLRKHWAAYVDSGSWPRSAWGDDD